MKLTGKSITAVDSMLQGWSSKKKSLFQLKSVEEPDLAEVLIVTSYPPRECGIATYSQDLIKALGKKFESFRWKVCAIQSGESNFEYPEEVEYVLDSNQLNEYGRILYAIKKNRKIKLVLIQHEFGLFASQEEAFQNFIIHCDKPIIISFHTVLPNPSIELHKMVKRMVEASQSVLVMTNHSAQILINDYQIPAENISVIAHGTHLVPHLSRERLKSKYSLEGRRILSTFGLLSSGKSIETTLEALPEISKRIPDVLFLVIGKTHPGVVRVEGERYRRMLEEKVVSLNLQAHVLFINQYLALPELLEYLQLTDLYLFTSKDPNQAVSGTFSYAMSCACPIISTPIPHAKEVLNEHNGVIVGFQDSNQLSEAVVRLLANEPLRNAFSLNTLQKIVSTAWENSAVSHAALFERVSESKISLRYALPAINLNHIKQLTTDFGMIQFSKINQPDLDSGYTLDDNARAMISLCMYYEIYPDEDVLNEIVKYLNFIEFCAQEEGGFLNYVDLEKKFTDQNSEVNLDDSNGRAIWALGYFLSKGHLFSDKLVDQAEKLLLRQIPVINSIHSTRSMAFIIKGLYAYCEKSVNPQAAELIQLLANRLANMYKHERDVDWYWFESYLTYGNSILPEAMLCAWQLTGLQEYKEIAKESFDFLLSKTFNEDGIKVISNKSWLLKGHQAEYYGEQPIDVTYTILALDNFFTVFSERKYFLKLEVAFRWFLGHNHLKQIIYNPCTGGCFDGLEETQVNINQGAESTVSYLMARMTYGKYCME